MPQKNIENWWPKPLENIPKENLLENKLVVIAEISKPWGDKSYRYIYTALINPELVEKVL